MKPAQPYRVNAHTTSFGHVPYSFIHKLTFFSDAWHSFMHSMVLWSHLKEDEMFFCHKRFGIPIIKSSGRLSQVLRSWKFLKHTPQSLSAMPDNYNNSTGCLWHFLRVLSFPLLVLLAPDQRQKICTVLHFSAVSVLFHTSLFLCQSSQVRAFVSPIGQMCLGTYFLNCSTIGQSYQQHKILTKRPKVSSQHAAFANKCHIMMEI